MLPAAFSDQDVWTASAHRSKQRLPVVTYRHHNRRGTLTPSSPLPHETNNSNSDSTSASNSRGSNSGGSPREGPSTADKGLGLCPVLTRSAQPMVIATYPFTIHSVIHRRLLYGTSNTPF